jgi:hypothetical protein
MHPHEHALHANRRPGDLEERAFEVNTDELQITPSPDGTGVLSKMTVPLSRAGVRLPEPPRER